MSRKKDLTGQRSGHLVAIEETTNPKNKRKRTFWKCRCDCGNETIVTTSAFTSGKTQQCWECAHKQTGFKKRKDVVGKTYGWLTVDAVEYNVPAESGNNTKTICHCTCKCGNKTSISLSALLEDGLHSCGCARREIADIYLSRDVVGLKFGRLTIREEFKDETPRKVLCECDCGNEIVVVKSDVTSGHTQSCGCLWTERITEANEKDWIGVKSGYGVELLSKAHKNNHGTWLWNCKCPCCGDNFIALPAEVIDGHVTSCGCRSKSAGEELIENILKENNIDYLSQYKIDDCRNTYPLPFDFAILKNGEPVYLVEYDGKQHFQPINYFGGEESFLLQQFRDNIKTQYCKDHNIPLIRIPYNYNLEQIKQSIMDII